MANHTNHPYRVTKCVNKVNELYDGVNVVNFDGLDFPVHPRQIHKFGKMNANISVNVYMLERVGKELRVVPCHLTKEKQEHHINLLLIQPEDTSVSYTHLTLPTNREV